MLVVVLTVDGAEPQEGGARCQTPRLDIKVLPLRPVEVPSRPQRGALVQRHLVGVDACSGRFVRPIHVHARERDQPQAFGQRPQGTVRAGRVESRDVHGRVGPERGERGAMFGPRRPLRMEMAEPSRLRRLGPSAVDDQELVAPCGQLRADRPAGEPGTAEDHHTRRPSPPLKSAFVPP